MSLPSSSTARQFRQTLMDWYAQSHRPMPWKGIKNPYLIWLSEIILQQTRVEQGWAYFERFRENFPTVKHLAEAEEDVVMKLWEGLGYYSRARNLHATAKYIAFDLKEEFPKTYESLLRLKGVGPYTAAAIGSFAYDLPVAVVDGNVYRVLSRYFGITTPIDSTLGKKEFAALAQELLDKNQAGRYNQAIIDFGATQCKPKRPNCPQCPMQEGCVAYHDDQVNSLPIKSKKIKRKTRYFNYLVINAANQVLLQKRNQKDIWQNLYEFPLIESEQLLQRSALKETKSWQEWSFLQSAGITRQAGPFKQQLTHQTIIANFWEIQLSSSLKPEAFAFLAVPRKSLRKYAFPRIIDLYLQDKSLYLELL
ncbi:MAG: A/G-specific adenine glycosylase [Bacteroidota bacterium]